MTPRAAARDLVRAAAELEVSYRALEGLARGHSVVADVARAGLEAIDERLEQLDRDTVAADLWRRFRSDSNPDYGG